TEAALRIALCPRLKLKRPNRRHYQKIAEITVSRSAKMRVRETDYFLIVVLITGAIFVSILVVNSANIVRLLIGIRRKLHRPERHSRSGEGVSHLMSPDQRIYITDVIGLRLCDTTDRAHRDPEGEEYAFHFNFRVRKNLP